MAKKLAKKKSPAAKARKKTKVTSPSKKLAAVKKSFTKTELLQCLVESTDDYACACKSRLCFCASRHV